MALRRQLSDVCKLSWRAMQRAAASTATATATHNSSTGTFGTRRALQLFSGSSSSWAALAKQHPAPPSSLRNIQQELQLFRGFAAQAAGGAGGVSTKGSGKKSPISFNSMILAVGAFLAVVAIAQNKAQKKVEGMMQRSQEVVGKAAVGGPFTLTDQDGKQFTQDKLLGQFNILYFGFTHCPDICPDELEKLAVALDLIEQQQSYKVCVWQWGRVGEGPRRRARRGGGGVRSAGMLQAGTVRRALHYLPGVAPTPHTHTHTHVLLVACCLLLAYVFTHPSLTCCRRSSLCSSVLTLRVTPPRRSRSTSRSSTHDSLD